MPRKVVARGEVRHGSLDCALLGGGEAQDKKKDLSVLGNEA